MMRGRGGPIRKGIQGSSGRAFAAAGERTLDDVAREYGVAAATLERWRSVALTETRRERAWSAAARLDAVVTTAAMDEGIAGLASKPVLHGDNGATLKATTVLAMLYWLGVKLSYSRPRFAPPRPSLCRPVQSMSASPIPGASAGKGRSSFRRKSAHCAQNTRKWGPANMSAMFAAAAAGAFTPQAESRLPCRWRRNTIGR